MTIEVDSHLKLCWDLAKRDRKTYSPNVREFLDKIFLNRLDRCEWPNLKVKELSVDLKHIAQTIDDVQYIGPHELSEES